MSSKKTTFNSTNTTESQTIKTLQHTYNVVNSEPWALSNTRINIKIFGHHDGFDENDLTIQVILINHINIYIGESVTLHLSKNQISENGHQDHLCVQSQHFVGSYNLQSQKGRFILFMNKFDTI